MSGGHKEGLYRNVWYHAQPEPLAPFCRLNQRWTLASLAGWKYLSLCPEYCIVPLLNSSEEVLQVDMHVL